MSGKEAVLEASSWSSPLLIALTIGLMCGLLKLPNISILVTSVDQGNDHQVISQNPGTHILVKSPGLYLYASTLAQSL